MSSRRIYLAFAGFYFAQFAALGIYVPFFPLYLKSLGFEGPRIGILMALAPVSRFLFPAFWGIWADRGGHRRRLAVLSLAGSAVAFAIIYWIRAFLPLAAAMFAYGFLLVPAIPLVEGMVQEEVERGRFAYGQVRLWGSLGFILTTLAYGRILDRHPPDWILAGILGFSVLNLVPALALPSGSPSGIHPPRRLWGEIRRPAVLRFLVGSALMQASHGAYYAYFSLYLDRRGYTRTAIGGLWTLAVVAEVLLMLLSGHWMKRAGSSRLLSLCFAMAILRWILLARSAHPVALLAAQILHAFSFGLFHVCAVSHTHRLFPPALRSSGQSLFSSLTYGLGNLLGFLGSAALIGQVGMRPLFMISSGVALGGLLLSLPPRTPAAEPV